MTTLNPGIMIWARNTAGLSLDQAAQALGFQNAQRRSAAERLSALEAGEEEPSRSVLLRMAKAYRRSLLVFYLQEPPRTGDRGQDFRTVRGAAPPHYDPILDALIRDIRRRQAIVNSLLEDAERTPVDFIGSASMNTPAGELAKRMADRLGFSLTEFRRQSTVEAAFNYLREKIEAAGVFVLLAGNLGSHHTNIPVDIFRGFAIADPTAPFVIVNDQDAKAAWSFTALHELGHLWLGTTGISGTSTEARIERYCNDVAGEILFPSAEVREFEGVRKAPFDQVIEAITLFAGRRKISRAMVAYKLLRTDVISEATWNALSSHFKREWISIQENDTERSEGGPSYYVVKRHRLGNALLGVVSRSLAERNITYTKAAQVLGVKPINVDPLLNASQGTR